MVRTLVNAAHGRDYSLGVAHVIHLNASQDSICDRTRVTSDMARGVGNDIDSEPDYIPRRGGVHAFIFTGNHAGYL
jgi:hypothetical protein